MLNFLPVFSVLFAVTSTGVTRVLADPTLAQMMGFLKQYNTVRISVQLSFLA
jgi:uncharacterized membrane protein